MAKKKTEKARKLTDAEIVLLGDKLIDTSSNIYSLARSLFGDVEVNDEAFDRLEKIGSIFRCDECSQWKSVSMKCDWHESCCEDCAEEE